MVKMVHCFQWAGGPILKKTWRSQRCPISRSYGVGLYSTAPSKPNPRPKTNLTSRYPPRLPHKPAAPKPSPVASMNTLKHIPLVQLKPRELLQGQITAFKAKPEPEQKTSGVFAPRVRVTIGVILIGSILYSMVNFPPPFLPPWLTQHASSHHPSNSPKPHQLSNRINVPSMIPA